MTAKAGVPTPRFAPPRKPRCKPRLPPATELRATLKIVPEEVSHFNPAMSCSTEFRPARCQTATIAPFHLAESKSLQHLSRPILMREISKPVGVMLIDCLQLVVVTAMAAENAGP